MQPIVDFVLEIDRLKSIERKVRPTFLSRFENSAEHSWQLCLFATSLATYAETPLELSRVVQMLLLHDLGEIDTGDTIVFAQHGWPERKAAELVAVKRIFRLLPEPTCSQFLALWEEFEAGISPEARFAHAVDRAMPVLLNLANGGGSWLENNITYDRVVERIGPEVQDGCPALWDYLSERLQQARANGWFGQSSAGDPS